MVHRTEAYDEIAEMVFKRLGIEYHRTEDGHVLAVNRTSIVNRVDTSTENESYEKLLVILRSEIPARMIIWSFKTDEDLFLEIRS